MATIELDLQYHLRGFDPDDARIKAAADWIANQHGLSRMIASIAVVGDEDMRRCNRDYLGHDYVTDVISFELDRGDDWVEGEVIANAELATRLAPDVGWSASDELLLYVIHGLLHVAGMDDTTEKGAQQMRVAEQQCLMFLGVNGAEQHLERWKDIGY